MTKTAVSTSGLCRNVRLTSLVICAVCLYCNAYRLFVGKPEEKRLLGRPRRRRVDNIRMDLGEVGLDDVDWIGLAQDRNMWIALVNAITNLRVPQNAGRFSSGFTTGGLSSSAQLHRESLSVFTEGSGFPELPPCSQSYRSDCTK
jgi:hypothetical protein